MTTYSTFLPVFRGFYCNGNFEIDHSSEIEYIHDERKQAKKPILSDIELDFDTEKFNNDVCRKLCTYIQNEFNYYCTTTQIKITFERVVSPKFYNYVNDSVDCQIECDVNALLQICQDNLESFTKYVKDNFTSRSGFWSFQSNDVNDWLDIEFINDESSYRVGAILNFICTEVYELREPSIYDLEIYESEYFTNVQYYIDLIVWNDETICFNDSENFEKGCFWFRNFSELSKENYQFDNKCLTIQFVDTTNKTMNQLECSPLIDFEYELELCEK